MEGSKSWIETDLLNLHADTDDSYSQSLDRHAVLLISKDDSCSVTDGHYKIPATFQSLNNSNKEDKELLNKSRMKVLTRTYRIVKTEHRGAHFVICIEDWEPHGDSLLELTGEPIDINSLSSVQSSLQSCLLNIVDDSCGVSQMINSKNDSQDLSVLIGLANQANSQDSCHSQCQQELDSSLAPLNGQSGQTAPDAQKSDKQASAFITCEQASVSLPGEQASGSVHSEMFSLSKNLPHNIITNNPLLGDSGQNVEKPEPQQQTLQVSLSQETSHATTSDNCQPNQQFDVVHLNVSPTELLQEMGKQSQEVASVENAKENASKYKANNKRSQNAVYKKGVPFTFPLLDFKTLIVPEDQEKKLSQLPEWLPNAHPPTITSSSLSSSGTCHEDSMPSRGFLSQSTLKDSCQAEQSNQNTNRQNILIKPIHAEAENSLAQTKIHCPNSKALISNTTDKTPSLKQSKDREKSDEESEGQSFLTDEKKDNCDGICDEREILKSICKDKCADSNKLEPNRFDKIVEETSAKSIKSTLSDSQHADEVEDNMINSSSSKDCSVNSKISSSRKRKSTDESQVDNITVSSGSLFSDSDKDHVPVNHCGGEASLGSQNLDSCTRRDTKLNSSKLHISDAVKQGYEDNPSSPSLHLLPLSASSDKINDYSYTMDSVDRMILDELEINLDQDSINHRILNQSSQKDKNNGEKSQKDPMVNCDTEMRSKRNCSKLVTHAKSNLFMPSVAHSSGEDLFLNSIDQNCQSPHSKRKLSVKPANSAGNIKDEDTSQRSSNETVDPGGITATLNSNSENSSETVFPSSSHSEPASSDFSSGSTNADEMPKDNGQVWKEEVTTMIDQSQDQQSENPVKDEKEDSFSEDESSDSPLLLTPSLQILRKKIYSKGDAVVENENHFFNAVSQPRVCLTKISPKIREKLNQGAQLLVEESKLNTNVIEACGDRMTIIDIVSKNNKSENIRKWKQNNSPSVVKLQTTFWTKPKVLPITRTVNTKQNLCDKDRDFEPSEKGLLGKGLSTPVNHSETKLQQKNKIVPSNLNSIKTQSLGFTKVGYDKHAWLKSFLGNRQYSTAIKEIKKDDQTIAAIKRLAENFSPAYDKPMKRMRRNLQTPQTSATRAGGSSCTLPAGKEIPESDTKKNQGNNLESSAPDTCQARDRKKINENDSSFEENNLLQKIKKDINDIPVLTANNFTQLIEAKGHESSASCNQINQVCKGHGEFYISDFKEVTANSDTAHIDLPYNELSERRSSVSVPSRLSDGLEDNNDIPVADERHEKSEKSETEYIYFQIPSTISNERTESQGFSPTPCLTKDKICYPTSQGFEPQVSDLSHLDEDIYSQRHEITPTIVSKNLESVQGLLNFICTGDKSYFQS